MPWQQLIIETTESQAEYCALCLEEAGALSVSLEDAADQPLLEPAPGDTPLWCALKVIGLFEIETDLTFLLQILESYPVRIEILEDQAWHRTWMDHFKPMCFGKRLWICPLESPHIFTQNSKFPWWPLAHLIIQKISSLKRLIFHRAYSGLIHTTLNPA